MSMPLHTLLTIRRGLAIDPSQNSFMNKLQNDDHNAGCSTQLLTEFLITNSIYFLWPDTVYCPRPIFRLGEKRRDWNDQMLTLVHPAGSAEEKKSITVEYVYGSCQDTVKPMTGLR